MCPHCKTKETLIERIKAIVLRRCSCGAEFYYPTVMNFALLFILIVSINVVPGIKDINFLFRALFFIAVYYASILVFDITGIFKRKYVDKKGKK